VSHVYWQRGADEDVDASFLEFFASQELVKFRAGRGDSLAGPVGDFGSAQALRVSVWKKELDSG